MHAPESKGHIYILVKNLFLNRFSWLNINLLLTNLLNGTFTAIISWAHTMCQALFQVFACVVLSEIDLTTEKI